MAPTSVDGWCWPIDADLHYEVNNMAMSSTTPTVYFPQSGLASPLKDVLSLTWH